MDLCKTEYSIPSLCLQTNPLNYDSHATSSFENEISSVWDDTHFLTETTTLDNEVVTSDSVTHRCMKRNSTSLADFSINRPSPIVDITPPVGMDVALSPKVSDKCYVFRAASTPDRLNKCGTSDVQVCIFEWYDAAYKLRNIDLYIIYICNTFILCTYKAMPCF